MNSTLKKRIKALEKQTGKTGWTPKQLRELAKAVQGGPLKVNTGNTQQDHKRVPAVTDTPR